MERLIFKAQRFATAILVPGPVVTIGAVALFFLLFVASASAAPVKSKLYFDAFGLEHNGTTTYAIGAAVGAKEKACVAHRQIRFYKETPEEGKTLVDTRTANRHGIAVIVFRDADLTALAGEYHAEVKRARKPVGSGRVTCLAASSKSVAIGPPPAARIGDRRHTRRGV